MTIDLPPDPEGYLRDQVRNGRFASAQGAIAEAIRRLRDADRVEATASEGSVPAEVAGSDGKPAWKILLNEMSGIPDEVFDRIPVDSSEQHDHYIYGTPKRSRP